MGLKAHQGKRRGGEVNETGSLSMQGKAAGVPEGQEVQEGSNDKRFKESKVTDLPVAV